MAGASLALAADVLQLTDGGRKKAFDLPGDELFVLRWGAGKGELSREVPSTIKGATIVRDYGHRVIAKLAAPIDRTKAVTGTEPTLSALPATEWQPIVYLSGVPRSEASMRSITNEVNAVLADGETPEQLRDLAGARSVITTNVPGRVRLVFANSYAALDAASQLQVKGRRADVALGIVLQRMSVPNDPFFSNQWHLRNIGQGGGTPGIDANVVSAWDISKGTGVHIVIDDDSMQTQQSNSPLVGGHPDLIPNALPVNTGFHYDFRDGDSDPNPVDIYDAHGTSVSGVAAARGNNGVGVSGSAPEANLVGLRTIGSFVTDADIASAVSWSPVGYDAAISNNSWGYTGAPGLRDIDITIKNALRNATLNNRGGRGQITVFANGNSQQEDDNGNYTTLSNSRFVIAVGAIDNFGKQSYYSNPGSNLLISAPSNGGSLGIFTTDVTGTLGYNPQYGQPGEPGDTSYTANFGGTSSATPLTTGCIALVLGANPNLGWRDVHEILAQTARKVDPTDADWADNGVGFHFNHKYGAGMIDATAAVVLGRDWVNLGPETSVTKSLIAPQIPAAVPDNNPTGISRTFDLSGNPNVRIERVEVLAKITTAHRSDLEVSLVSPSGKTSILAPKHTRPSLSATGDDDIDYNTSDNIGWNFTTTHHWGENSQGTWTLRVRDLTTGTVATLQTAKITMYGTASSPQRVRFSAQRFAALENAGTIDLHVERIGGSTGTATVDFLASNAVAGGFAPAGDYSLTPGTLTFADGETSKDITVTINDDALQQGNRSIYVILKNPTGASLGGYAQARLDIIDDESNIVSVAPGDFDLSERPSTSPQNPGTFIISRSRATPQPLTVNYSIGGTATEGADYATLTHTAVIPANATSTVVTISPIDDALREGTETIVLSIDASVDYGIGVPNTAQLNLGDNELVNVDIVAVVNTAKEEGVVPGKFTLTMRDPGTGQKLTLPDPLLINLSISGSAQPGVNYDPINNFVVIPAGQSSVDIPVTPKDDANYQGNVGVIVSITASGDYAFGFKTSDVVTIIDNEPSPDPLKPTVVVSAPANKASFDAPATVVISGTAKDNETVARVLVAVNDGAFQPATVTTASGVTSWTLDVTTSVTPGVNLLRVKSVDNDDNESVVAERSISYIQPRTLNVAMTGTGTVSKGYAPSSTRNAGFNYVVTATPAKGFLFAGWSGAAASNDPTLSFTMPDADSTLTAHFAANPFSDQIAGNYSGLLQTAGPFAFDGTGFLQVTVFTAGNFTGGVTYNGVKYGLKGKFTADQPVAGTGRFLGTIKRRAPLANLFVDLRIDTGGLSRTITGTVGTLDLTSTVTATRAEFDRKKHPYPGASAGPQAFTLHFAPPAGAIANQPHGDGYGTATIDAGGTVKLTGFLPDGTKVMQSAALSKDLTWPLFLNLYGNGGVALGDITVSDQIGSDMAGNYRWVKPARGKDKYFAFGFNLPTNAFTGEIYKAPAADGYVLSGFQTNANHDGTAQFTEGNLIVAALNKTFTSAITVGAKGKVTVSGGNTQKLAFGINNKTGTFAGSFVHPITSKKTPISGVFLQKTNQGVGSFLGTLPSGTALQTGRILITPTPVGP